LTILSLNMDFNSFLFPAPESSYTAQELKEEIIYIPKQGDTPVDLEG